MNPSSTLPSRARGASWRFIPTGVHGWFDHSVGRLLIVLPLVGILQRPDDSGPAAWVPFSLCGVVLMYSLLTDYEFGVVRLLPLRVHLAMDFLGGALLVLSPWLFSFHDRVYWPHVAFGLLAIALTLSTDTRPLSGATWEG